MHQIALTGLGYGAMANPPATWIEAHSLGTSPKSCLTEDSSVRSMLPKSLTWLCSLYGNRCASLSFRQGTLAGRPGLNEGPYDGGAKCASPSCDDDLAIRIIHSRLPFVL